MGLKITSEIQTSKGLTSEAYINVKSADFKKDQHLGVGQLVDHFSVEINIYLNEEDRISNPANTCTCELIMPRFGWISGFSPDDLAGLRGDLNAFEFAYSKITEELELQGFTVVDVID